MEDNSELNKLPLLLTVGGAIGVVIQAYLLNIDIVTEIHVFGTDNDKTDYKALEEYLLSTQKPYSITILKDYNEINSNYDQQVFEECLLRWYLRYAKKVNPIVCIAGGFKSMSASIHKLTHFLGASKVFHMLSKFNNSDPIEIQNAIANNTVVEINMGEETGWINIRSVLLSFLDWHVLRNENSNIQYIEIPKQFNLTSTLQTITISLKDQYSNSKTLEYPFNSLILLSPQYLNWLREPLDGGNDYDWIKSLPKIDLHCHLGGFATHGDLLYEVQQAHSAPNDFIFSKEPNYPESWPKPKQCISLNEYMNLGNATGSSLLKDYESLKKHIFLMYKHFCEQNLKYVEVRCSPDNYSSSLLSSWKVLEFICETFQKEMIKNDFICHVNLIVIATRKSDGDLSAISRHLALAITVSQHQKSFIFNKMCTVVGVDLAGFESKETRAGYFAADFIGVHRCGLAVTAHAGENDLVEGIWQAVFQLNTRRLGHALHLLDSPDLMRSVVDRKIGIEMCPFANYQIRGFVPMKNINVNYPLMNYLKMGALVSVNTDNIGISNANISDNYLFLSELCPDISRMDVLQLIRNAIETAFIPSEFRIKLISQFSDQIFHSVLKKSQ